MGKMGIGRILTLVLVAGLGACDMGTGPEGDVTFDTEAALDDYESMDAVLASDSWRGFQALGRQMAFQRLGLAPSLAVGLASELGVIESGPDAQRFAAGVIAHVAAAPPLIASADAVISPVHRGKTFVYDFTKRDYVVDPERAGAPDTGVRFIVYEHDRLTGKPTSDVEIGHADLIDEGDSSAEDIVLRLRVVVGERTALNYRTSIDDLGRGGTVTVDGFVQDDRDKLDFSITATGSRTGDLEAFDVQFHMGIAARDFAIDGTVQGTEGEGSTGDIDISVRHGAQSMRVDVAGTDSSIAGTFYLGDRVFATVSGDPDEPTFLSGTGEPLTTPEIAVLLKMVGVLDDVFDLFEELVEPIGHLVVLAILL